MRARAAGIAKTLAAAGALALVAGAGVGVGVVRASDHLDGPRATADPQADIADVFAFTSPSDPTKVVLAMTVAPYASDAGAFSPSVDYAFRVQRVAALQPLTLDTTVLDVVCTVDGGGEGGGGNAGPTMTCKGPGGATGGAPVGQIVAGSGPVRVFAGLRSDPAFFDRQGALATVASGRASFTGQNAFAGANVLAIVVELDAALFAVDLEGGVAGDGGGQVAPVLAVAAETVRRGP
jgi:hypothetical protein